MKLDEICIRKIEFIRSRVRLLREFIEKITREEFERPEHYEYGARLAEVIIQAMLDLGNHILAQISENRVETYREIFIKLGTLKVIPEDFARKIATLAGLRNILVHMYTELDLDILWQTLHTLPSDALEFISHILKKIKKMK